MTPITKKRSKIKTNASSAANETLPEQTDKVEWKLMIAEAAYYRAEQRGFTPDQETEDWLEAEKQIEEMLAPA